jgi:DNA-binding HxlR family transcriptional regulator
MSCAELAETVCNIARSLSVVGDRWSLMILHEMGVGACRFEVLQSRTRMSSHLLSGRLKKLEEDGILERRLYCSRPVRYEYIATAKGRDLDDVLVSLTKWGFYWHVSRNNKAASGKRQSRRPTVFAGPSWNAPEGELFSFDNCTLVQRPKWTAERAANWKTFYEAKQSPRHGSRP